MDADNSVVMVRGKEGLGRVGQKGEGGNGGIYNSVNNFLKKKEIRETEQY